MSSLNTVQSLLSVILLLFLAAGCTPEHVMQTAPVSGSVTCGGKTLTEGYITFTPIPDASANVAKSGKSGYAVIQSDGTYVVTTYNEGDGAIPGRHEVRVYKPDPEDDEQAPKDPFACGNKVLQVVVEEGDNVIDLDPSNG